MSCVAHSAATVLPGPPMGRRVIREKEPGELARFNWCGFSCLLAGYLFSKSGVIRAPLRGEGDLVGWRGGECPLLDVEGADFGGWEALRNVGMTRA